MNGVKRTALLVLLLVPAAVAAADVRELINKGTVLHDQGRYQEAIAVYREILRQDPENEMALYELTFSLFSAGATEECIKTADQGLKSGRQFRAQFYTMQANCLDTAGATAKAVDVYQRGLSEFPEDPGLAFNLAVTQFRLGRVTEAKDLFKVAIAGRPNHASAHFLLAKVYSAAGYNVPALFAALRFVAFEPVGERAKEAADLARKLLGLGVTRDSDKAVTITIDSHAPTDEGDFSLETMMLSMLGAARFTEEGKKKSESEQLAEQINGLLAFLDEGVTKPGPTSFVKARYAPFLTAVYRAGLARPFAYHAFQSLGLEGGNEWTDTHKEEMERLKALLQRLNDSAAP